MNKLGYESIDVVRKRGIQPLSLEAFKTAWAEEDAIVIDTRPQALFAKAFIPGSIFIGIDDNFAMWVGALITDLQQTILFVAEPGREEEVVTRLARVGYDHSIGYLEGGFSTWSSAKEEIDQLEEINAAAFAELKQESIHILDVRKASEYNTEHLMGAINFPLDYINRNMEQLNRDSTYYVHCAGGYRSVIAASILKSRGFHKLINIQGGYKALTTTDLKRSTYIEQLTEL